LNQIKTKMRLTVHVTDAKKEKIEVRSKEKPGTTIMKEIIKNTLSFQVNNQDDVDRILGDVEKDGHGIPVKHYLSGDNKFGRVKKKKKA